MPVSKRRNRSLIALLSLAAAAIFVLPASEAGAVVQENACVNSLIPTQSSKIPVTTTATATPNPVLEPGNSVTLEEIKQELAIPPAVFVAGYNAGVLTTGLNEIPTELLMRIIGTNTVEGEQLTNTVSTLAQTTISDPDGEPGTGDETATPGTVSVTYANQTWTALAPGPINFREKTQEPLVSNSGGIQITAKVGPGGVITARFGCDPGEVEEAALPETIVLKPGTPFASTTVNKPIFPVNLSVTEEGEGTVACFINNVEEPCNGTYTSYDQVKVVATPSSAEFNVGSMTGTGSAAGHCNPATGVCEFEIAADSSVAVVFVPASTRDEIPVGVHGEVPQTTTIEELGCASVDLGTFVPGAPGLGEVPPLEEGHSYEGGCLVTLTSTGQATSLTAADETGVDTGFLTQKLNEPPLAYPYSLAKPLFIGAKEAGPPLGGEATPGGALVSPVTLMNWATPVSKDPVGVGFRQPIGENDPLHTGVYAKTITLTLQQTTP
jgi:hypothetical protein